MAHLGAAQLLVGDVLVAQLGQDAEQLGEHQRRLARRAGRLHLEHRTVAEGIDRSVHRIGEALALDHVELQPGGEPVVEDAPDQQQGGEVLVVLGGRQEGQPQLRESLT